MGPEHIAAHDPGSDIVERLKGHIVIDSFGAALLAIHPRKHIRIKEPLKDLRATNAKGVLQILPGPRAKAIQRNRKSTDFHFAHLRIPPCPLILR